jgi:AbrB family looped-hinge helix DNA binding protein
MGNIVHTKLGEGRRVAIPAELCHEYGIEPGDLLVLESTDTGIIVRPISTVIREVQEFFADAAPTDVVLSDELLRDRREEAKRENRG